MVCRRILVNGFIVLNVVSIFFWSFPWECAPKSVVKFVSGPFMRFTGLWQGWDMFAPDPVMVDWSIDATVTFRDGSSAIWTFPEMQKLGFLKRYQKERYRKWSHDNLRSTIRANLWKPTALYIARQFDNPLNPPVRVELYREARPISPPGADDRRPGRSRSDREKFYQKAIVPEDL